jgi:hypothetical protein
MLKKQRRSKKERVADSQLNEEKSEIPIELTSQELSFIMQFGNYYSGFSPEWELFR